MPSVYRATKVQGKNTFQFDDESIAIVGDPKDADWRRWGMLSDRKITRMYCFKGDTKDKLYQFIFRDGAFRYDENLPQLSLTGLTDEMDTSTIAMLSTPNFEKVEGYRDKGTGIYLPVPNNYHVYMQNIDKTPPVRIHQILWDAGTDHLRVNGITRDYFDIQGFPEDTDWGRWAVTYDSNRYQLALRSYVLYAFKEGSDTQIYFGRYGDKDDQGNDVYGYKGTLELVGGPADTDRTNMCMVFDGAYNHCYMLAGARP